MDSRVVDHSRRGRTARRKGSRGELEVVDLLRAYGWDCAHRNFGSGAQGGGDLVEAIDGWHIEIKRVERLNLAAAWRQAERAKRPTESVLLAHRGNMQPWMATVLLTDLFGVGQVMPWKALAIGPRASVRAELMAVDIGVRSRVTSHKGLPLVVSQVGSECCGTLWLDDFLGLLKTATKV